jgi:two-component system nitrogen regulation sensor histidine kinase NtrY
MKYEKSRRLRHEHRILLMALLAGLPGSVVALALLWLGDYTPKVQWTLAVAIAGCWLGFAFAAQGWVVRPLQTLANLLAALREGDFSIRVRSGREDDALGAVISEVNALGETLREQRLGAVEATLLLRTVMEEIDVAIFTFDERQQLRLVNRAGERLLAQSAERLLGRSAADLGLAECLEGDAPRTAQMVFPGGMGRWGLTRSTFREGGLPHQLIVLTDLSRALREEERQAWQRLLRVLGHELNNSLAPIRSIAGSLESLIARVPLPEDWRDDVRYGLSVINARAEALTRFMEAYSKLARLPQPRFQAVDLGACVRRVLRLETRMEVALNPGPDVTIQADPDQLEQLLINLTRNAVDAALETGGGARAHWRRHGGYVEVSLLDDGPGLSSTANLFVPFFTTKPGGSGIGLVLSRQIAEAHGGSLTLQNRAGARGCEARLRLPV